MSNKLKLLSIYLLLLLGLVSFTPITANAATTTCDTYSGDNVNSHNYYTWADTIKSYLTSDGNGGLMRVQGDAVSGKVLIEYYDASYNIKSSKTVDVGLPIFGAFYETIDNYYILSGQVNAEENDSVEVFRLAKYDKDWELIDSCGLYGANTYIPFDAGSARITSSGKYMFIRTAHEMYESDDGLHHQANVTIQVDMDSMTITDSYTDVMNTSYGYVSHSFNQFIKTEGNNIIAVDHGDAYPRSIVLLKYNTDFTTGIFVPDYFTPCTTVNMMVFSGTGGQNYTGASIGGFEISDSSYIVAGSSVDQNNNFNGTTRNVFVAVASRDTENDIGTPTIKWITNNAEGEETNSTPHLVKINDNKFILLWSQEDKVYYTQLDGEGNKVGSIYSFVGALSDCVPYLLNGKLIWYTWDDEVIRFYDINMSNIATNNEVVIKNGHEFTTTQPSDGSNVANQVCETCGHTQSITVPTSYDVWWGENNSGLYYSTTGERYYEDDIIGIWIDVNGTVDNEDMVVEISDTSVATLDSNTYDTNRDITINKAGKFTVTIYPRYNTSLKATYTINVIHKDAPLRVVEPTYTSKGYTEYQCENCGEKYISDYVDKLVLEGVTGFAYSKQDFTAITLKWTKVANADGYVIEQYKDSKWTEIKTINSNGEVSHKVTGLSPSTSYKFRIKSYVVEEGTTVYGEAAKATVKTLDLIDLSKATLSISQPSFGYTGEYIKPVVTVKINVNGKTVTLTNWEDYKVNYKNFKNPGTATITVVGRGHYTGEKSMTFTIRPVELSKCSATIKQPSFGYTGEYIKPVVTVKAVINGKTVTLINWKDYKVTYKNFKNPGVATITIESRGITSETKTLTFQIRPSQVKNIKYVGKSTTYVNFKWDSCVGVTGYEVYRTTTKTGTYTKVATVTTTSYKNTGLKSGETYYYKVRAYKTVGSTKIYGNYSAVYTITTK